MTLIMMKTAANKISLTLYRVVSFFPRILRTVRHIKNGLESSANKWSSFLCYRLKITYADIRNHYGLQWNRSSWQQGHIHDGSSWENHLFCKQFQGWNRPGSRHWHEPASVCDTNGLVDYTYTHRNTVQAGLQVYNMIDLLPKIIATRAWNRDKN